MSGNYLNIEFGFWCFSGTMAFVAVFAIICRTIFGATQ